MGERKETQQTLRGGKVGRRPSSPVLTPWTTQLLEEHTEWAPRISQEFGERMAHCCLGGLAEFLQRYAGCRLGWEGHWGPGCSRGGRYGREDQGLMGRGAVVGSQALPG